MEEREFWIVLNAISGMAAGHKLRLINEYGSAQEIFRSKNRVVSRPECRPLFIQNLQTHTPEEILAREEKKALSLGVKIITPFDPEYPALLKEIYDPPLALYVKGPLGSDADRKLSIVGSRRASYYGQLVTERITQGLLAYGFCIVSGLARGIDSIAHRCALEGGGKTAAVLGSGLDIVYPPENKSLFERIAACGSVMSEFPFGTEPHKMNFPIRNRIISGLSPAILIVEAREKSGALITAGCALDQGREVLAIPGNIYSPNSRGTNQLIKQGARLVEGVEDILEELGFCPKNQAGAPSSSTSPASSRPFKVKLNEKEGKIFALLSYDPMPIDVIIQMSGFGPQDIHNILLTLEMKGIIKQLPGKLFFKV
ncbi:MAG: DNA-processing protein DprA [bacterium]